MVSPTVEAPEPGQEAVVVEDGGAELIDLAECAAEVTYLYYILEVNGNEDLVEGVLTRSRLLSQHYLLCE